MTAAVAYLRQARLEIAPPGIAIERLRTAFEIRQTATASKTPSTITVTNLSPDVAGQIDKGAAVRLRGGYVGSPLDVIYEGEIERVDEERSGLERQTRLLLGAVRQASRTAAVFARAYPGLLSLPTIVSQIAESLEMPTGPLDAIPDLEIQDYVTIGKAEDALTGLLRPRGVEWFVADGVIQFSAQGRAGRPLGLVISEATGLIGSPSRTEDGGARAKVRLNPLLRLGGQVRIASQVLQGDYKITALVHKGDTWDGAWATEVECVA